MVATLLDADGLPPTIYRGATTTWVFHLLDVTVSPTAPKNLNGATEVSLVISRHRAAPTRDLVLALTDSPPDISHDDAGGNVTATISQAASELLPAGDRWAELWVTDAAGRRELVGEGICKVWDTTGVGAAA